MRAIFSNPRTWSSSLWSLGCDRDGAESVVLIRTEACEVTLDAALTDELTADDLPPGWDVEAANVAIDRLLERADA
jgi:hypothetical protein